jgi:branched-chain amino acid transport system ATP-binding protein
MTLLEVKQLSAGYGRLKVLEDVSFDVAAGELALVLGPNGAGKTTLLRALSGICTVTKGEVSVGGLAVVGMQPFKVARAGLAHVSEGRQLFAGMSVADNLDLGTAGASSDTRAKRIELMASVFDLFPVLNVRRRQIAGTMSGGEQQMLAIGRALMSEPLVIALDEPSTGLAPGIFSDVLGALGEIGRRGTGVVLVEQVVPTNIPLPGKAILLSEGRIILRGEVNEVLAMPNLWELYRGIQGGKK